MVPYYFTLYFIPLDFFPKGEIFRIYCPSRVGPFWEIVMQIQILQPSEGICDKSETGTAISSQAILLIKVLCFKTGFNQG